MLFCLVMGVFLLHAGNVRAQTLDFSSFLIDTHKDHLVAVFSIDIQDFEKIRDAMHDGNKMSMHCSIQLYRHRTLFWNKKIHEKTIVIDLEKDLLTGEYLIIFPDKTYKLQELKEDSFDALFKDMSINLSPLEKITPGRNYRLQIGIRVISRDVPKWIKATLFFLPWDIIKEVKYEMDFSF